ncbi:hypothetical protein BJ508DRAFT_95672 [Ascobolus immersus RN42]|uniref:F-box domain-containing protein n=1 Tax=Ascobolus immersus RN42 TaxID=1160509 RepID=A0A3N4IMG6_ASCIM|nr:hypothetical protein BJ508DRAFT_95672 [Ascobolus immersus RN42]
MAEETADDEHSSPSIFKFFVEQKVRVPQPSAPDATQPHHQRTLLTLPTEIRLEIYKYCSTFALLLLCLTCQKLRYEINDAPSTLQNSFGFSEWYPDCPAISLFRVRRVADAEEQALFKRIFPKKLYITGTKHVPCYMVCGGTCFRLYLDFPRLAPVMATGWFDEPEQCRACQLCSLRSWSRIALGR